MSLNINNTSTTVNKGKINALEPEKEKENKYLSGLKNIGSVALAYGGYEGCKYFGNKLLRKQGTSFYREGFFSSMILNGKKAKEIFDASGLAENGVTLKDVHFTKHKHSARRKNYTSFLDNLKNFKLKKLFKNSIAEGCERATNRAAGGIHSFYMPQNKTIINNFKSNGMSIPHEMGHAKNYTSSNPIFKMITKARGLKILAPAILAVALLRKPKQEGEKSESIIGKGLDFVKENCVGLTAACMAPTVIEEGIASIRGAKMAKNFLDPTKLKALNIFNLKAWGTYVISAGIAIAGVYIANKIRNATAPKSEMERDVKYKQEGLDKVA